MRLIKAELINLLQVLVSHPDPDVFGYSRFDLTSSTFASRLFRCPGPHNSPCSDCLTNDLFNKIFWHRGVPLADCNFQLLTMPNVPR